MKTKQPVNIMMFGMVTSEGNVMPSFNFFPTWSHIQLEGLNQVPRGGSVVLDQDSGLWNILLQATRLCHATQIGEPSFCFEKFSTANSHQASGCLAPQIEIPLICGALLSYKPNKTPYYTKDELKGRITAAFTNSNKKTTRKTENKPGRIIFFTKFFLFTNKITEIDIMQKIQISVRFLLGL